MISIVAAVLILSACPDQRTTRAKPGAAAVPSDRAKTSSSQLPAEVRSFIKRRAACDHFRGEDPSGDAARAREIARHLSGTCTGSDALLKKLRRAYAGDAATVAALADYEEAIE